MFITKLKAIGVFISIIFIAHLFMLILLEFMVGCGTKEYFANGTWETMPCAFIPYETTTGTWRN
jgi:hypothetical protein|tara:strand:+ start:268 stop:459 length:192 start_codon:yes stop_codon:yes gene_type:complete